MPYRTQHRGFEARAPYNTVEPVKEEEELKGSQFLDKFGQDIQEGIASATADQEGIVDDLGRLALGGLKNIGHVTNLPGIKQALQIAGAPAHYAGQAIGAGLEHGLGIDPRFGHIAGQLGEMAIPGYGAYKIVDKLGDVAKYTRQAGRLSDFERAQMLGRRTVGGAGGATRDLVSSLKIGTRQALNDGKLVDPYGMPLNKDQAVQSWTNTQWNKQFLAQDELDRLRNLVWELDPKQRMLDEETLKHGLSIGTQRVLDAKDAKIIQRKEYFDRWYERALAEEPMKGWEKAAFANARKAFKDEVAAPPAAIIDRWVGKFGLPAYGKRGPKQDGISLYGGAVKRKEAAAVGEAALNQHHNWKSTEGFEFATQEALLLDNIFRVNTHQYLASKGMVPGHSAWNMLMLPEQRHLKELHPWLKEMGFETYWKAIDKTVGRENPKLFYDYIDRFFDEVFTPSLQKAEELMAEGHRTLVKIHGKDGLITPAHVQQSLPEFQQKVVDLISEADAATLKSGLRDMRVDQVRPDKTMQQVLRGY